MVDYDEFGLLHENIEEFGLPVTSPPIVERVSWEVEPGRSLSGLKWGRERPAVIFVHGGAQNAHTWDTVALALGRPALAIDLAGHGHSDWREDGAYTPINLADDIARAVGSLVPGGTAIVGMSLGGLTAMEVAVRHPGLTRALVMVDITPGVNEEKTKAVTDFVDGPQSFDRFDDLLERTMEHNPTRSESSLRRGILHNAHQLPDGSWQWRYDRSSHAGVRHAAGSSAAGSLPRQQPVPTTAPLWEHFASVACPLMLVRGSLSPVVDDEDVAEARRLQPAVEVQVVEGAGHSVQGDRPVELAALIDGWLPA